ENNLVIQTALIDMYGKMGDVKRAEEIFTRILNRRNVVSFGAMMKCYNVNELPERTIKLYEEMIRKEIEPDNVTYVLVISACGMCLSRHKGTLIYEKIRNNKKIMDDIRVNTTLIHMYGKFGDIDKAKQIFDSMFEHDVMTYNAMINSLGLVGQGYDALKLFRKMKEDNVKPVFETFGVVLNACGHSGLVNDARKIFYSLDEKYRNSFVTTTMVSLW
ncbi:unnamed protein product, partial [Didymodactylos carnosus]